MARMRPDWSFAMSTGRQSRSEICCRTSRNVYWLGGRDYSVLPNYCRAFDVNMMCFASTRRRNTSLHQGARIPGHRKARDQHAGEDIVTQYCIWLKS